MHGLHAAPESRAHFQVRHLKYCLSGTVGSDKLHVWTSNSCSCMQAKDIDLQRKTWPVTPATQSSILNNTAETLYVVSMVTIIE